MLDDSWGMTLSINSLVQAFFAGFIGYNNDAEAQRELSIYSVTSETL